MGNNDDERTRSTANLKLHTAEDGYPSNDKRKK